MSWFSIQAPPTSTSSTPTSPPLSASVNTINPVTSRYPDQSLFGTLTDEDTAWLAQSSGFVTETQTFYITLPGGKLVMCQVIHSAVGLWYPQIQFTFRYHDPETKTHVWKSTNVTNFKVSPPSNSKPKVNYDRRSCKSDQFSILLDPSQPTTYHVNGKHDNNVSLDFSVTQLSGVPGWKLGHDAQGGFTYFGNFNGKKPTSGNKPDTTAGSDGYVVHRFWPRCSLTGEINIDGQRIQLATGRAIFIHAVQGMRPNLIASRWNFCNFQSVPTEGQEEDQGVSLITMEFTTVPGSYYGPAQTITVGSVTVGDKLVTVVGSPGAQATHEGPFMLDPDTGYQAPAGLSFGWKGPMIEGEGELKAGVKLDLKSSSTTTYETKGLIEKVDVMAQIPYLIKKFVATVAGARPYIYTWHNPAQATIEIPSSTEASGSKTITVDGYMFNEATFVSDL